jgi:hypothetical protein
VHPLVPVLLMVLGLGLSLVVAVAPVWWPGEAVAPRPAAWDATDDGTAPGEEAAVDPGRALTLRGLAVLRRWDLRRAAAYADTDPRLLHSLYTPGSEAGRRDRALLERYAERGLVVRGVLPQIRSVALTWHRPGRLRVEVQERYPKLLVRRSAGTGEDSGVRRLGESRYRARAVELRRSADGWRVAAVERA